MAKKLDEKLTYAQAHEELKKILGGLEEGEIDVDHLTDNVNRASELLEFCQKRLKDTEVEVKKVVSSLAAGAGTSEDAEDENED